jgi:hypothetical protein
MSSLLVFNRVYILEIQSLMVVLSTGLVNFCPSNHVVVSGVKKGTESRIRNTDVVCAFLTQSKFKLKYLFLLQFSTV